MATKQAAPRFDLNGHKPEKPKMQVERLVVPELRERVIELTVRGLSPLIIRAWDSKTSQQLADKQAGKNVAREREAVKAESVYEAAKYVSTEGWEGIPASAFKAAMAEAVSVLKLKKTDFNMKLAKKSFFVCNDGVCRVSGRGLVRIHGKPEMFAIMQPTSVGGPYMSYRPRYRSWKCNLRIVFNDIVIDAQSIINLLTAAGHWVGVGEHRPSAKESMTGESGRFEVLATK